MRVYGRNEPGFEAPPARAALAPGAHDQDVGVRAEQLLRRGLLRWARHPALWVGMIVLLTLKAFHIRKRFVATHKNIKI